MQDATKRFVDFADFLPERLLLVAADGRIQAANRDAMESLFGGAPPTSGQRLTDFIIDTPAEVADYLRLCSRSREPLPGTLTFSALDADHGSGSFRCEGWAARLPAAPKSPRLVVLRLTPKQPAVRRFFALNEKIDQLTKEVHLRNQAERTTREQRELLRITLASIGDAVIATDTRGCVTFMNSVAESCTGWSSEAAIGAPLDEVFVILNERTRAPVESPVQKVLATGTATTLANHTILVCKDGTELPIDDSGAPIRDASGKLIGVVLVFREISERRKLERELQGQAEALRDADQRKDDFLAMLGHELRNPLAPLHHCVQILRKHDKYPVNIEQLADMMERQTTQLARIVDDLLDVSRITRGLIRLEKSPIPLATVLQHAIETTEVLIAKRGHELQVNVPAEILMVDGDLARLSQVFCNLLTNAAKFMDPGGVIRITGAVEDGSAMVRVRDHGVGIDGSLLPYIFDLFSQGERSRDRAQGGLGIGLKLVKTLVEMHDGDVSAHSEGPGKGSEFVVRLPLAIRKSPPVRVRRAEPRQLRKRVLIVDDNVDAAQTLAIYLGACGCEVQTVHEARAAIEIGRSNPPDAILLDIGLPGMDGFEAARQLRALPGIDGLKIIAVTGYGSDLDRQQTRDAGFDHHLTKPVDLQVLLDLLA